MEEDKVIDFSKRRKQKQIKKYTEVKPIKKLTPEEMKSTVEFIRRKELED